MVGVWRSTSFMRTGSFGILRFIIKNWYFFILLIVLLPTIIGSITQAIDEKNPTIPFIQLGLVLINADAQIAADVQVLKENPEELIGSTKPTNGIWKNVKYYFGVGKVIIREAGLIWAILFPFIIIFRYFVKPRNKSEVAKNVFLTVVIGLTLVFIVNLLMIVRGFVTGELISALPEGISFNQQVWLVVIQALPFHGLVSLALYLINLASTTAIILPLL